jgi:hypothetical protein
MLTAFARKNAPSHSRRKGLEHTVEMLYKNRPETWFTPRRRTVGFPSFGFTHEDAFMPWKETRTVANFTWGLCRLKTNPQVRAILTTQEMIRRLAFLRSYVRRGMSFAGSAVIMRLGIFGVVLLKAGHSG